VEFPLCTDDHLHTAVKILQYLMQYICILNEHLIVIILQCSELLYTELCNCLRQNECGALVFVEMDFHSLDAKWACKRMEGYMVRAGVNGCKCFD